MIKLILRHQEDLERLLVKMGGLRGTLQFLVDSQPTNLSVFFNINMILIIKK